MFSSMWPIFRALGAKLARPASGARLLSYASAVALVLAASSASAAPKDDRAMKSFKQAMEEDYLDTRFDDAEKKLQGALSTCGASGCSPAIKAKIYMGLGVVLLGGKSNRDEAKKAFIEGLRLDPKAEPDPDYVTSEIESTFADAKKSAGSGKGPASGGRGDSIEALPVDEQRVNTPVPIYVTVDDDISRKVSKVTVTYVPVGGGGEKTLELERSGKAYRGNIPCGAVSQVGSLEYWVVAKDRKGKALGTAGSSEGPLTTTIRSDLDGKAPSWPGFAPPETCAGGDEPVEDTSSHRQCIDDKDCPSGEGCSVNECLKKPETDGVEPGTSVPGEDDEPEAKLNWFRLTFAPDFSMVSGEDVCGFSDAYEGGAPELANDPTFVCVRNPEGENHSRYLGKTTPGQGNNVNFGFGVATMRLMLGYDRVLIKGLSIGARVGWAFNGTNEEFASFIPVHAEGRLAYTIGKNPFGGQQVVRPWVALSGGLAQVDTAVDVDVLEDGAACGAADVDNVDSPCTVDSSDGVLEPRIQTLRAIKQAGLGFAGLGVGVSFVPVDLFEINVGIKFSVTFPYVVPVFSPELGLGVGF